MHGLWLENGSLELRTDLPTPAPPKGEALVRVLCAGICNTDLELVKGYAGFAGVPGHEFVGRVERADGQEEWIGTRVVGGINAVCGACDTCRAGRSPHCERRTVLGIVGRNGALAEHLILPIANLLAVPDELDDEVATFVEPTAAAFEILEQVRVDPRWSVAVIGDGKLGLLVGQVLAAAGTAPVVVGHHPAKLALLTRVGISAVLGSATLPERRYDVVVECSGRPAGLEDALRLLRPRGTLVLKSTYAGRTPVDLAPLVVDEITVIGSRCGPFAPALEAMKSGLVDPRPLIDAFYPLSQAVEAFEHARRPGALKVLIRP